MGEGASFINLTNQDLEPLKNYVSALQAEFDIKHVLVIGMGGSMLGPQAIHEALYKYKILHNNKTKIDVSFADNPDADLISNLSKQITEKGLLKNTLILVQSKSGNTPETVATYEHFKNLLIKYSSSWYRQIVVTTSNNSGYLALQAEKYRLQKFHLQDEIGGRYSVLSPIGLLLAELLGLNSENFLEGAKTAISHTTSIIDLASNIHKNYNLSLQNLVIFCYSSRLRYFCLWCVQLLAESLGKKYNLKNEVIHAGLNIIPAFGATDQHSQLQLFKEGPKDKQFLFVYANQDAILPIPEIEFESFSYLNQKSFNNLLKAEYQATADSLSEDDRPVYKIERDSLDEHGLGYLFMYMQLLTDSLGCLMNIDAYNQPGVERSKALTKKYLSK